MVAWPREFDLAGLAAVRRLHIRAATDDPPSSFRARTGCSFRPGLWAGCRDGPRRSPSPGLQRRRRRDRPPRWRTRLIRALRIAIVDLGESASAGQRAALGIRVLANECL